MRRRSLSVLLVLAAAAGCPGGGGGIGDPCGDHGDCASSLQCVANACAPRCQRAPECGDGYACNAAGYCVEATGQPGDACTSEVDCAAGLACELEVDHLDDNGHPLASCVAENSGRPAAAECSKDGECRNGTCALGHCVDLCRETRDCGAGTGCSLIPRIEAPANGAMFAGCLQSHGSLRWSIPIHGPSQDVLLPIPDTARSVVVTFEVQDPNQKVGAVRVVSPAPTSQLVVDTFGDYYASPVRHRLELSQSVLAMPSSPSAPLVPGAYTMTVASQRLDLGPGSSTPSATAVVKLDSSVLLDLHFYFLDFDEHPCASAFGGAIDAQIAQSAAFFQNDFLGQLRTVFAHGGVALGTLTYEDLRDHPDLDGLEVANAGALLALGTHPVGVNVFFVRTLSPVGLQAFGPNPGPAGLAGTRQSGIVVGLDTLCFRSWSQVARLTAHELARYMGLYDNIEVDDTHLDPIDDSDTSASNLMFYSELGGGDLSLGQRDILSRSAVLR
jgi:hypothetical protein